MENVCHKSLENTAPAEEAMESTETEPWDTIGVSSKNILNASQCSEEHVLKCTFNACDPEQRGEVSVFRIIEYLQEMTGQSCEDWRFHSLYIKLDPEERGVAVDFPTFHQVMKDWIADCRQDGEEAADLMNNIKDLQQGNKQLVMQNVKLQRTIEAAEELNSRLSEELAELKGKLRSTQQALEQARVVANELEDLKFFSKKMEEENSKLHTQSRLLEKEQQLLLVQVDNLQEENRKLLVEKENSKNKIKQLCTEKAKIKSQLFECENLISCKDTALNKKEKRTEELTVTLDEYQMIVQELKLEINKLQKQQYHSHEDVEMLPRNSLENMKTCTQASAQPLSIEIGETQKEFGEEDGLPSPLCGTLPFFVTHAVTPEESRALTGDLELSSSAAKSTKMSLQKSHSSFNLSLMTDGQSTLKNEECRQQRQQQHCTWELMERTKEQKQVICTNLPETTAVIPAEQPEPVPEEQALGPEHHELMPAGAKKLFHKWFEILTEWFLEVPLGYLLLHILQKLVLPGLLLACVLFLAIVYLVPPYGHHLVWTEPRGNPWPQLQLQYLRPPPT